MVTDLTRLAPHYGFARATELIEAKRRGEKSELAPDMAERWKAELERASEALTAALTGSPLPEEPANESELEEWLVAVRKAEFES